MRREMKREVNRKGNGSIGKQVLECPAARLEALVWEGHQGSRFAELSSPAARKGSVLGVLSIVLPSTS